ncbi:uncharacterized protein LOC103314239 [Tribolium castaneum]|uniref:uncharacterized protein LOC103314239 n=1 Tax=Tribolium castaneum TaxID=7070 RepID=UPI0030FE5E96
MDVFELSNDDKFVDLHGREIPAVRNKQEDIALSLAELKPAGVAIYQKSQYEKLSKIDVPFDSDFVDYMLESAKNYMLNNKVSFSQDQIMRSIENCKSILIDNKNPAPHKQPSFLQNRSVAKGGDDEILIQVTNKPSQFQPPSAKHKIPNFKNINPKLHVSPKTSPKSIKVTSQVENGTRKPKVDTDKAQDGTTKLKNGSDQTQGAKSLKRFTYNIVQEERTVYVTKIDKRNCIWVRDKANDEIFELIHDKVNEEAKHQKVPSKPWKTEKVYMAQDKGCWFRCKIARMFPLTVFFLDYGNVAEVDENREISEDLAKIPCMATRITFKEAEYLPILEDEIRIKNFYYNRDGPYFVNILSSAKKAPIEQTKHSQRANEIKQTHPTKTINDVFFKKPPLLCEISDGQTVVIVQVVEEMFYLKTKECFAKLKVVKLMIEEYSKNAKSVENVKVNQVILHYNSKTNKLNRAIVLKVNNNNVEIETFDYPGRFTTDLENLKSISEQLSKEPVTCLPGGRLTGFENKQLGEDCKEIIAKHIQKRTKFRVVLGFDDELDLFDGNLLLSEQLQTVLEGPRKIYVQDVTPYRPAIGVNSFVCGYYNSSDDFAIVPMKELQEHIDCILRCDVEDNVPYVVDVKEVCLCYFVDQWYRCVVTRIFDKDCEVRLLDFGNVTVIRKENLRRPDDDIMKVPILALPCKLTGLPHQNVEAALKKIILKGEIYDVDVKSITGGKCHVELPKIYAALKG